MQTRTLLRRNLTYFWRTNLAVTAGVAVAVAVLAGALLVGDSVRASLHDLVLQRLGAASFVITSEHFFREQLAADLSSQPKFKEQFAAAAPLIVLEGSVSHEKSGRAASSVQVYAVDERFFAFHGRNAHLAPQRRQILLSPALAREFGAAAGDAIRVRVQNPTDVPLDTLHGRKEELGRTMRFSVREVLAAENLGEFSLRPQQGEVRAVFVPLARVQQDLKQTSKANTILISSQRSNVSADWLQQALRSTVRLEDFGLRLREAGLPRSSVILESDQILLSDAIAESARATARKLNLSTLPVFTYLATTIRIGSREIPYSLVAAVDEHWPIRGAASFQQQEDGSSLPPLWLNDWAARELNARKGDRVTLQFLVWEEGGRLTTRTAEFVLSGSVMTEQIDREMVPQFPGISESPNISDWNPPFPVDLKRIRKKDEDYWHKYRTLPKAMISLPVGQVLWQSRYGRLTSFRFVPPEGAPLTTAREAIERQLRGALDPEQAGMAVVAAKEESATASRGAVNFGEYFVYFSFFLVISAALLVGLFFRLGIEQRLREIGLLEAIGFDAARIRGLFLREGAVLAAIGCALGVAGAVAYGALMMYGLKTWWVGAVGTTALLLHVEPVSLVLGGVGGFATAMAAIVMTMSSLRAASPRGLLHGEVMRGEFSDFRTAVKSHALQKPERAASEDRSWFASRRVGKIGAVLAAIALLLLGAAAMKWMGQVPAFFGAGSLLLAALVSFTWEWLANPAKRGHPSTSLGASSSVPPRNGLMWLGMKNARWRPGRSLLCVALVASATFVLVAVDAFRREGAAALDPKSGTGGYPLMAETLLPVPYDPNTREGKQNLNLGDAEIAALEGVNFVPFRLRPGDDASCLNLYQPRNPKVLGVPQEFVARGRFSFSKSLAQTPEQAANPWQLLEVEAADGTIPAIGDANSLTYVMKLQVGDEFVIRQATDPKTGKPIRLRIVGALRDSIFQSELLIAEKNFLRVFPYEQGFRFFLADAPAERAGDVTQTLESGLSDYGFDVTATAERLAAFHRVENTFLSTFQALGGFGLLLGTLGLGAVLLRNVFERRRELALLRAVGYRPVDLGFLVVAENALLLALGLGAGVLAALLAIAPALVERGGTLPFLSLALILAGVWLTGLAASLVAVRAVVRAPLLEALRSE